MMVGEVRDIAVIIAREHKLKIPNRTQLDALVRWAFENHLPEGQEDPDGS